MADALRALIEPAPCGIVLIDEFECILEFNSAARELPDLRAVLGIGRSVAALRERAGNSLAITEAAVNGPGGVRGVIYLSDLTHQRAISGALAHREAVAAAVRDAMIETDVAFRVVGWNRAAELIYGWSAEEACGRAVEELLRTELSADETERMLGDLADQGHVLTLATQHTRSGEVIEVEASVIELRDAVGEPSGYVAVNRDISERRRLEKRLRETRNLEMVGRLAGGVAHDLNSQLTAIMGYAELTLGDRELPEHVRPDVREVLRAAERAGVLTAQLLAFSRQQMLAPRSVELATMISESAAARQRLVGRRVELIDHGSVTSVRVLVDPIQMKRVLLDVAANAGEAMSGGGRLITRYTIAECDGSGSNVPAGRYVRLEMTDTGTGMDEETLSRAFDPFFTTKHGHTGLGLSTVYGFMGQSGGHVTLESAPGGGTTVVLYLPPA